MPKMGLVLQGGGALGAYEYGAVTRLVELGWRPVAVTGVSIGAATRGCYCGCLQWRHLRKREAAVGRDYTHTDALLACGTAGDILDVWKSSFLALTHRLFQLSSMDEPVRRVSDA